MIQTGSNTNLSIEHDLASRNISTTKSSPSSSCQLIEVSAVSQEDEEALEKQQWSCGSVSKDALASARESTTFNLLSAHVGPSPPETPPRTPTLLSAFPAPTLSNSGSKSHNNSLHNVLGSTTTNTTTMPLESIASGTRGGLTSFQRLSPLSLMVEHHSSDSTAVPWGGGILSPQIKSSGDPQTPLSDPGDVAEQTEQGPFLPPSFASTSNMADVSVDASPPSSPRGGLPRNPRRVTNRDFSTDTQTPSYHRPRTKSDVSMMSFGDPNLFYYNSAEPSRRPSGGSFSESTTATSWSLPPPTVLSRVEFDAGSHGCTTSKTGTTSTQWPHHEDFLKHNNITECTTAEKTELLVRCDKMLQQYDDASGDHNESDTTPHHVAAADDHCPERCALFLTMFR